MRGIALALALVVATAMAASASAAEKSLITYKSCQVVSNSTLSGSSYAGKITFGVYQYLHLDQDAPGTQDRWVCNVFGKAGYVSLITDCHLSTSHPNVVRYASQLMTGTTRPRSTLLRGLGLQAYYLQNEQYGVVAAWFGGKKQQIVVVGGKSGSHRMDSGKLVSLAKAASGFNCKVPTQRTPEP